MFSTIPHHKERVDEHLESIVAIVQGIGPRDAIEGLLSVQMVVVHHLAMAVLAGAMVQGQTSEGACM
jgi:hypothetical protein